MKFLKWVDAKLMSWFGGVDAQGKPKLHPFRMGIGNVVIAAYLIYRLRGLTLGRSVEITDLDMLLFLPLHSIYSFRAKRRYEKELQRRELEQLFRPITIAPAVIVPPHMQVQPKRLDRVKVAVRKMHGRNSL